MSRLMNWWFSGFLVLAISAVPATAGSNDAKPANENAANATAASANPAPASPSLAPTAADANVTALLGVLVTKGVLAPTEAAAIRNAAPDARFQLLVDALSRKGILNAADLSAATNAAPQPSATSAAVEPVTQTQPRQEVARTLPRRSQRRPMWCRRLFPCACWLSTRLRRMAWFPASRWAP